MVYPCIAACSLFLTPIFVKKSLFVQFLKSSSNFCNGHAEHVPYC
jgi:hypothetical protein